MKQVMIGPTTYVIDSSIEEDVEEQNDKQKSEQPQSILEDICKINTDDKLETSTILDTKHM